MEHVFMFGMPFAPLALGACAPAIFALAVRPFRGSDHAAET
jgi:hypothetical protein